MNAYTDITVECHNPKALDETVQQLGPAAVIDGSWNGTTCIVRVFGPAGYIKFAINHQGYGKVVSENSNV